MHVEQKAAVEAFLDKGADEYLSRIEIVCGPSKQSE